MYWKHPVRITIAFFCGGGCNPRCIYFLLLYLFPYVPRNAMFSFCYFFPAYLILTSCQRRGSDRKSRSGHVLVTNCSSFSSEMSIICRVLFKKTSRRNQDVVQQACKNFLTRTHALHTETYTYTHTVKITAHTRNGDDE